MERGVRQGDPLSPYLFIIVIELLAIRLREDPNIVGFKINESMQKLSIYADDMTVAVTDLKSAKRALEVFKDFAYNSGLKINMEKTEGMWLGKQKNNIIEPLGILWPKTPIKALGIFHSYNEKACEKANFDDKIDQLIKQLHWWKARMLSLTGKVLIVKALGISKFALISSLLHVPEDRIKKINTIIFNFIWNGKTDKVKRKIIIQKHEYGGIRMVDFKNYVNASKCKWIQRYLSGPSASWKVSFEHFCNKENLGLFLRSKFEIKELPRTLPRYYMDSLTAWNHLRNKSNHGMEFIWYNKQFKINNKTVYSSRLFQAGLWISQDLYFNRVVIPFDVWLKRGAMPKDFLTWRGLVQQTTRPNGIKKEFVINSGFIQINTSFKKVDYMSQSEFQQCFNEDDYKGLKPKEFKAKIKHESIHGIISEIEWKHYFTLARSLSVNNFVKDLQYKLLYRFLGTNRLLYKMNKIASPNCSFCKMEQESIEHLFYECAIVKMFWRQVFAKCNQCINRGIMVSDLKIVMFGLYKNETLTEAESAAFNLVILLGKSFIWCCKQSGIKVNTVNFQARLSEDLKISKPLDPIKDYMRIFLEI